MPPGEDKVSAHEVSRMKPGRQPVDPPGREEHIGQRIARADGDQMDAVSLERQRAVTDEIRNHILVKIISIMEGVPDVPLSDHVFKLGDREIQKNFVRHPSAALECNAHVSSFANDGSDLASRGSSGHGSIGDIAVHVAVGADYATSADPDAGGDDALAADIHTISDVDPAFSA